ncbi:tyrosine-type recombinase/integrase [Natranaerobius trueperi]|uniref:Integrase n=1 Tax=Natranaerobius trueperi TaxID=759412 RepID=A0A226BWK8_9FIRM|nr:tyrosine-type recombinase/integrase [Natranaerobius trueperi]OWZ83386.1 integrase [Natranaerobius trueperi]
MERTYDAVKSFFNENRWFSHETARVYRIALNQFFSYCKKDYDKVKRKDIREWLKELNEKELKPRSRKNKLMAIKSFYNYLFEENLIEVNLPSTVEGPQIDDDASKSLSRTQLKELMELVKNKPRERALVDVIYFTGVRISECLNIRLEDIKWDVRQIWIRKGKRNKERFVLFTSECEERLKNHLKNKKVDSPYLFSNRYKKPLTCQWAQKFFRKCSKELGYKVTPHILRHTFAVHLAEKGMEDEKLQLLLGHKNINDLKTYTNF